MAAHSHVQEPTLGGILSSQTMAVVDGRDSVTTAAGAIAKGKKAVRHFFFTSAVLAIGIYHHSSLTYVTLRMKWNADLLVHDDELL